MTALTDPGTAPTFSIVIPCRNEEANAVQIAAAVVAEMERVGETFDILFIDNASDDRTVELIRGLCARDPRIRLIVNVRNFGQMRSPTHAIFQARGKAVIAMCADFQDPPELLPRFVERWRAGADIVLGVRVSERSSVWLGTTRRLAYWFANKFGDYPIIPNATGFGLFDRRVVATLSQLREPEPFFRGMLVETGHGIETVSYPRPRRAGGKSNNNFFALLDFALSGVAGSSKRLVRVPFYVGALALAAGGLAFLVLLASLILGRDLWHWAGLALFELHFGASLEVLSGRYSQHRLWLQRVFGPGCRSREPLRRTDRGACDRDRVQLSHL